MPGERLIVEDGTVRARSVLVVSAPASRSADGRLSATSTRPTLLEHLEESVRFRLMSDVPLGAMLSGGLDSSLIVALMARNIPSPSRRSRSDSSSRASQRARRRTARRRPLRHDHHELELSFARDDVDVEELVWHLDEPLADRLVARIPRTLRACRESVSRSRSPARVRMSFSAAIRRTERPRSRSAGESSRAVARRGRARLPPSCIRRVRGAPQERSPPTDPVGSTSCDERPVRRRNSVERLLAGPLGGADGRVVADVARALAVDRVTTRLRLCTSTPNSALVDDCSTTSTAPRWRIPSRSACRSSIIGWWSFARRFRVT